MKINTVFYLLEDVFFGRAIARDEGAVEALSTTASADGTIAVGTAKPCVNRQFEHAFTELLL